MVKFTAKNKFGGITIGLGLSALNLEKLRAGMPVNVDFRALRLPSDIDLDNSHVIIFYGDTEKAMKEELSEFISVETKVSDTSDGGKA